MTTYYSESKKAWLEVAEVKAFQLVGAYNKMFKKLMAGEDIAPNTSENLNALLAEIKRRGLDPAFKGGRPPEGPPVDETPVDDYDEAQRAEDEAVRELDEDRDEFGPDFDEEGF